MIHDGYEYRMVQWTSYDWNLGIRPPQAAPLGSSTGLLLPNHPQPIYESSQTKFPKNQGAQSNQTYQTKKKI